MSKKSPPALACLFSVLLLSAPPALAQAPNGWIQNNGWLLFGPLSNPVGCSPGASADLSWLSPNDIATIAPEDGQEMTLDASAPVTWQGAGDTPAWSCLSNLGLAADDIVNMLTITTALSTASGKTIPSTNVMAVFATYVTNVTAEPIPVQVLTSGDDAMQVWVNDQKVQQTFTCVGVAGIWTERAPAVLLPGTNAIKVILWQGDGDWGFRVKLARVDLGPITDLDPDISFGGCAKAGDPPADPFRVTRSLSTAFSQCPSFGAVSAVLSGTAGAGDPVTLRERIEITGGDLAIESITGGGILRSFGPSSETPVGIFENSLDIGVPCTPGSTVPVGDGAYAVTGSGADIWQEGDQFQFAYVKAHGDFDMVAHLADKQWAPGSNWGKVGIMARQEFSPLSRYSMIQAHGENPIYQDRFAGRTTNGGNDNFEQVNLLEGEHRDWMRLERVGSLFSGYFSLDGVTWDFAGSMDWGADAPHTVLLGLGVCSHAGCPTTTITFDEVEILGGADTPGSLYLEGGEIVWENVPRATLAAGVGYTLRGTGRAVLTGYEEGHAIEGPRAAQVLPADEGPGIFPVAHDIGGPCTPGSTVFDSGADTYTVTASGSDIWVGNDQFQFAYMPMTGNFSLRAHLIDRQWAPGVEWGKGGIMIRENCEADTRYSFLHDSPDPDSTRYAIQRTANVSSNSEFGLGGHPDWLRLDRIGDVFAGYTSTDGVEWTLRYKEAWASPVPESVLAGLALTSHAGCPATTFVYDEVSVSPIDYWVVRSIGEDLLTACPPVGPLKVDLKGSGPAGPNVLLREEVLGEVQVKNITGGGVFEAYEANPVGMWLDARDVGGPCVPGSTVKNLDESYTLSGSGIDMWTGGDQFQFAYTPMAGDFTLTVYLAEKNWAPGSRWGKVGVTARESLDGYSRYVSVQDHGIDPQDQTRWACRPTHLGADNYETVPLAAGEHHDWLRIERQGTLFIGYSSIDGVTWVEQGRQTWTDAPDTMLVGLHVCSHSDCGVTAIKFDSIDLTGTPAPLTGTGGGVISWNAPRSTLNSGVSYELEAAGNANALFKGTADGIGIAGLASIGVTAARSFPDAIFPGAHDIGIPCTPGSTVYDPSMGTYAITGSGVDIWQGGDQFQFASTEQEGNYFIAIAHVADKQWAAGSRWGKVGIMAREDCTRFSRYGMIQIHGADPQDQDRFACRPTYGGTDNNEQFTLAAGQHRDWLRLDRDGSVLTGYFSTDGATWERQGSVDLGITAPSKLMLGLAVCSHSGCPTSTITFDQVQLITERNHPPVPCIATTPSPPTVVLAGGQAEVTLDATCSNDGDGGTQTLTYQWTKVSGPTGATIESAGLPVTRVTFTQAGTYRFQLTLRDSGYSDTTASQTVDVVVTDQVVSGFRRGDADGSGKLDLTDAIATLQFLYMGYTAPACKDAADTDDSGVLDLTDAIASLQFQFMGGTPPAAPGPTTCGPDPTPGDQYTECTYTSCAGD